MLFKNITMWGLKSSSYKRNGILNSMAVAIKNVYEKQIWNIVLHSHSLSRCHTEKKPIFSGIDYRIIFRIFNQIYNQELLQSQLNC